MHYVQVGIQHDMANENCYRAFFRSLAVVYATVVLIGPQHDGAFCSLNRKYK